MAASPLFRRVGQKAAHIVEKIGKEGGKVAIIQNTRGSQSEGRTTGAKRYLKALEVELVSIQPANWDRNTAYNITTNLLQSNRI